MRALYKEFTQGSAEIGVLGYYTALLRDPI